MRNTSLGKFLNSKITNLLINQGLVILIPLILTPYLLRVVDIKTYGKIVFTQSIISLLIILLDWSYNWSIVTENKKNEKEKNSYAINAYLSQFVILILLIACWIIFTNFFDSKEIIYGEAAYLLIAQIALPYWYYLFNDSSNLYSRISVCARTLSCALILIFVNSNNDAHLYFVYQSLPLIIFGFMGTISIIKAKKININEISLKKSIICLIETRKTFQSKIFVISYTNTIPIILGLIAGTSSLAIYSLADKVRVVMQAMISPFLDKMFFSRKKMIEEKNIYVHLKKNRIMLIILATFSFLLFFFSNQIISLVGSEKYIQSVPLLRILAWAPLIIVTSNLIGLQYLYKKGFVDQFNSSLKKGSLCGSLLILPLIYTYGEMGACFSVILVELIILVKLFAEAKRIN